MSTTTIYTWDEIMDPVRAEQDKPGMGLWHPIRVAATHSLERSYENPEGYIYGITSSDINHTIFGVAKMLARHLDRVPTAAEILTELVGGY